jgi:hypothetical protein
MRRFVPDGRVDTERRDRALAGVDEGTIAESLAMAEDLPVVVNAL